MSLAGLYFLQNVASRVVAPAAYLPNRHYTDLRYDLPTTETIFFNKAFLCKCIYEGRDTCREAG